MLPLLLATLALTETPVYIGTYTGKEGRGIYRTALDPETGRLSAPKLVAEATNPSFLAVHPSGRFLYAVLEVSADQGRPNGGVASYAIDPATGDLSRLNERASGGAGPCYLTVDRTGRAVLVANYGGGSVASLPIDADGKLGEPASVLRHEGRGVDPRRQEGPHAHSIDLDASNRFAVAADLGVDRLFVYRFDPATATLTPNDPPATRVSPGSGPRHVAFHPDGKHAYVINELALTITGLDYDPDRGTFTEFQTVSTLPEATTGRAGVSTAEILVHPSGRFLYGSNREHDSIAAFRVDEATGRLTLVEAASSGGKTPRNFGIDPSGRFLLAANQDSGTVVAFRIDEATGRLRPTGATIRVGSPVCVRFLPGPR